MAETKKTTKSPGFSAEEKAAMKEHARELKASQKREDLAKDQDAKIAELSPSEQKMAKKIHAIVAKQAPELYPKTFYGMPGWANSDNKVVVFFQPGGKFNTRYSTLGFQQEANLDDGDMWACSWALTAIGDAEEKTIAALVKKAVS